MIFMENYTASVLTPTISEATTNLTEATANPRLFMADSARTNSPSNLTSNLTDTTAEAVPHADCLVLRFEDYIPWDNADTIVSFEVEDAFRRVKDVVFLPVLFLIGGPANVINMAVFYRRV